MRWRATCTPTTRDSSRPTRTTSSPSSSTFRPCRNGACCCCAGCCWVGLRQRGGDRQQAIRRADNGTLSGPDGSDVATPLRINARLQSRVGPAPATSRSGRSRPRKMRHRSRSGSAAAGPRTHCRAPVCSTLNLLGLFVQLETSPKVGSSSLNPRSNFSGAFDDLERFQSIEPC